MIIEVSCPNKCHYSKELFYGAGIMGCDEKLIKRIFFKDITLEFEKYKNENRIKRFMISNEIAYCSCCNEIKTTATLKYELNDGTKITRINKCDKCKNELNILEYDNLICPSCGSRLIKKENGMWD